MTEGDAGAVSIEAGSCGEDGVDQASTAGDSGMPGMGNLSHLLREIGTRMLMIDQINNALVGSPR